MTIEQLFDVEFYSEEKKKWIFLCRYESYTAAKETYIKLVNYKRYKQLRLTRTIINKTVMEVKE